MLAHKGPLIRRVQILYDKGVLDNAVDRAWKQLHIRQAFLERVQGVRARGSFYFPHLVLGLYLADAEPPVRTRFLARRRAVVDRAAALVVEESIHKLLPNLFECDGGQHRVVVVRRADLEL